MDEVRAFLAACEEGDVCSIERYLDSGLHVNCSDTDDVTGLQMSAANGHESVVCVLLMWGAGLDVANALGWTPLLHAARHGHVGVITLLLQHQADINATTKLGANALLLAARGGHLHTVKLLIEAGIDTSSTSGIGGSVCEFTPLQIAAQLGHDTVVRLLLDRVYDVNFRTPSTGINSLMLAALNGHMTTAQILTERGADTNRTNVNNHTPLDIAALCGKREVKGYLDRKTTIKSKQVPQDVRPDIIEAAKQGNTQWMRSILDEDPLQRDATSPEDGATPLMFAAMNGRLDLAQLLVERGCDLNKQDTISGWSALMQAMYHGKKAVAKFLVNAGADVLLPTKNGCTAFDMASLIDDIDTELYRLLAARAVHVQRPLNSDLKKSPTWSPKQQNKHHTSEPEPPKTGLKAWWGRMSNRFRNLKLGRTFSLNTNRLTPLSPDTNSTANTSPKPRTQSAMMTSTSLLIPPVLDPSMTSVSAHSIAGYETLIQDSKKNAAMYTLGMASTQAAQDSSLKPVVPPFHPPPTFQTDRGKMPPTSSRKSISSLQSNNFTMAAPRKLLQAFSTQTLSSTNNSPSASLHSSSSPSSSGGASALHRGTTAGRSSASSSTLTAGSNDNLLREAGGNLYRQDMLFTPRNHTAAFTTPNSRKSYTLPASTHHRHKSGSSSRDSASTLTPSHSPTSKQQQHSNKSSSSHGAPPPHDDGDLGGLLKTLSLECYQPIFEEQEVDMEAFLTLTDTDLRELGISHGEPRRQILSAISELNSGKGRERQQLQETMSQYTSSLLSSPTVGLMAVDSWVSGEENQASHSGKSRGS